MLPMGAPANPAMNAGLVPQPFQPGVAQAGGPLPAPVMPGAGPLPAAGMPGEMSGQFPPAAAIQLATSPDRSSDQPDTRGSTPNLNKGFESPFKAEKQFQETRTTGGRAPSAVHDSSGAAVNSGMLAQAIRAGGARLGAGRA